MYVYKLFYLLFLDVVGEDLLFGVCEVFYIFISDIFVGLRGKEGGVGEGEDIFVYFGCVGCVVVVVVVV